MNCYWEFVYIFSYFLKLGLGAMRLQKHFFNDATNVVLCSKFIPSCYVTVKYFNNAQYFYSSGVWKYQKKKKKKNRNII